MELPDGAVVCGYPAQLAAFARRTLAAAAAAEPPPVPTKDVLVVLVRHGERLDEADSRAWNKILEDAKQRGSERAVRHDPPLTAEGAAQAQRAGGKLRALLVAEYGPSRVVPGCHFAVQPNHFMPGFFIIVSSRFLKATI